MRENFTRNAFRKNLLSGFIGIILEKSIGTDGAKDFPESVSAASVLSVKRINCHLNGTKKQIY
jgi:hypothetical protein